MQMTTSSEDETLQLGRKLALVLRFGDTIALNGELGAGKTVISRGVARGLGIKEAVTSPTFTVVQEYRLPNRNFFFHLDMYRIDNEESALAFGIEDYLFSPDAVTMVEWPERIPGLLPDNDTIHITLEHLDHDTRRITIDDKLASRLNLNNA